MPDEQMMLEESFEDSAARRVSMTTATNWSAARTILDIRRLLASDAGGPTLPPTGSGD